MTTKTAYLGARIYHDGILIEDHALLAENGKTLAILAAGDIPADATVHHLDGGILTPGFIETQANGGGGYLVNDRFDADGLAHILAAHRQYGTVAMLPTFITDAQDNYHRAIASIAEASRTVPGILGGHFEGPFLSPEKKGTHNPAYLRTPDESDFACFAAHADALQYSIISLAPERVPAGTVRRIREMGIRVNAAHTMAGKADMQRAWAEGLGGVTHLYNAMPPLAGRDPADVGSSNFERDQELSLAQNAREMADQARLALHLFDEGQYGLCEVCGNPIGKGRLQVFPRATMCVACKQREERR